MGSLFNLLEREWRHTLGHSPRVAARLPEVLELADGARSLEEVRRWVSDASPAAADRVLAALAARAVEGDELAARVLLHLLLPGTRRLATVWWALGDREEREAATVAAVYGRIRSYPLARRPAKIAANVLLDAGADLRRQVRDQRPVVPLAEVGDLADRSVEHPADELVAALHEAVAAGIVTRDRASLIAATRIGGRPLADIARALGKAPKTMRTHRQNAEAALASLRVAA